MPDQVHEAAPWLLPEMPHQYQSLSKLSKRSKVFTQQTQTLQSLRRLLCRASFRLLSSFQTHTDECRDSAILGLSLSLSIVLVFVSVSASLSRVRKVATHAPVR